MAFPQSDSPLPVRAAPGRSRPASVQTKPDVTAAKRLRFRLETLALRGLAWLMPRFSRCVMVRCAHGLGWLAYYLLPRERRIARVNLDTAFGDTKTVAEKRRIARVSIQNFAATLLGLLWSPRLTRETLADIVEIDPENLKQVQEIRARRRSLIFVTLHYGDWELLGLATGFYGIPVTVVQETMANTALGEILSRLRARSGHRIISSQRAAAKLIKALQRGEGVALLIDQYVAHHHGGQWLNFFGLSIANSPAIGWLAMHSGAAILPAVAYPTADGRVRFVYGPEIPYRITGNAATDAQAINQQCMDYCERIIREQPEYWLWSYKRWKTRPTVELGRYPFYSRYKPQ